MDEYQQQFMQLETDDLNVQNILAEAKDEQTKLQALIQEKEAQKCQDSKTINKLIEINSQLAGQIKDHENQNQLLKQHRASSSQNLVADESLILEASQKDDLKKKLLKEQAAYKEVVKEQKNRLEHYTKARNMELAYDLH